MTTVVIGHTGTAFRPPCGAQLLDDNFDIDYLDAPNVAFSVHRIFLRAVSNYIAKRNRKKLKTTIFVWDDELHILDGWLEKADEIFFQKDLCCVRFCLREASKSCMTTTGVLFALCETCYTKKKNVRSYRELNPDCRLQRPE